MFNFKISKNTKNSIIYPLNSKAYPEGMIPDVGEWISLKGNVVVVKKVNAFKPRFDFFNNFVSVVVEGEKWNL